jgi:hypothetical protein
MQFIPRAGGPNSPKTQRNVRTSAPGLNFIIVSMVFVNLVPLSEEKGFFRTDYRVFSSRLPVSVVSNDDLQ